MSGGNGSPGGNVKVGSGVCGAPGPGIKVVGPGVGNVGPGVGISVPGGCVDDPVDVTGVDVVVPGVGIVVPDVGIGVPGVPTGPWLSIHCSTWPVGFGIDPPGTSGVVSVEIMNPVVAAATGSIQDGNAAPGLP